MMAREQGNLEAEMKEVSELLHLETGTVPFDQQQQQQQKKYRQGEVCQGAESSAAAAAASSYDGASVEESKRDVSVIDYRHDRFPTSGEDSVVLDPRSAAESSTTEDSLVVPTGKKRPKKGRLWKNNRGKQKANASEPDGDLLSISLEKPPSTASIGTSTPTSASPQESHKKPENDDDHGNGNGLEVQTDSTADSTQVDDQSGSQMTGENGSMKDILDFEDEQKYEIEIEIEGGLAADSPRPILEWGLCGEDDIRPPGRTPPRTPPLRESRVKNKGQVQGQSREQPPSPGYQLSQSQSPREPWRRKPLESRGRQEPMRGSSGAQPQSPVVTIEAHKLEGLSEWNRIKAMQHSAAAEVASHKNWIPRKGIQRGGEGGDHNKARGKAKQGRGEQNLQHSHQVKELARQKFEADLRVKKEELFQRSKQTLKAEFQRSKRIEASRKGRDELELELERNLVYCDGELIYLNQ